MGAAYEAARRDSNWIVAQSDFVAERTADESPSAALLRRQDAISRMYVIERGYETALEQDALEVVA